MPIKAGAPNPGPKEQYRSWTARTPAVQQEVSLR